MKRNYAAAILLSLVTTPLILFAIFVGSNSAGKAYAEANRQWGESSSAQRAECPTQYEKCREAVRQRALAASANQPDTAKIERDYLATCTFKEETCRQLALQKAMLAADGQDTGRIQREGDARCEQEKRSCEFLSYAVSGEGVEYSYESGWPYPFLNGSGDSLNHRYAFEPVGLLADAGIFFLASIAFWLLTLGGISAIRVRRASLSSRA